MAGDLFGGDVLGSAVGRAGFCLGGLFIIHRAGQTQVSQLGDAILGQQDVLGLDVAMDQVAEVGMGEGRLGGERAVAGGLASEVGGGRAAPSRMGGGGEWRPYGPKLLVQAVKWWGWFDLVLDGKREAVASNLSPKSRDLLTTKL